MVSVIMPAYNADEKMLQEAIDSILNQSFTDFELIVVDDGSKDYCNYEYVISHIKDRRVKAYKNEKNSGVAFSLNAAIEKASGEYIIRMDSDDISRERRIETLVRFMDENPEIGIAGSFAQTFGAKKRKLRYPTDDSNIRIELLYNNSFCHPTVIMRRSILDKYGLRYSSNVSNEYYCLWVEASKYNDIKFANIPEYLLRYRVHSSQVTSTKFERLKSDSKYIVSMSLTNYGIEVTENVLQSFINTVYNYRGISTEEYDDFIIVFGSILKTISNRYPYDLVVKHLSKKYKEIYIKQMFCYHNILSANKDFNTRTNSVALDVVYYVAQFIGNRKEKGRINA